MWLLATVCLLLLQTGAYGFGVYFGSSMKHEDITEMAILNTTLQVCLAQSQAEGKYFMFPSQPLTPASVAAACESPKSIKSFQGTITTIQKSNRWVDVRHLLSPAYHFDDEKFAEGRNLITDGLYVVKVLNKQDNIAAATEELGRILHTLQDFYSHSNWVEMENKSPNIQLIRTGTSIGNIAAKTRATCRKCDGSDCRNNILEDILEEKMLTSGYFSVSLWPSKPKGKCSHGQFFDTTSYRSPKGGINKDKYSSVHGHLHAVAANLAVAATQELLEDIRGASGDQQFLNMMGISRKFGKALCFVIDTTMSMEEEIDTFRTVASNIIDQKFGAEDEPVLYILVPFNDPGRIVIFLILCTLNAPHPHTFKIVSKFWKMASNPSTNSETKKFSPVSIFIPDFGPVTKTRDAQVFKDAINSLSASGGGDAEEMSLSGLQLALSCAPPNSEIFLFTDGAAKDMYLKSTLTALVEQTKSTMNFVLTSVMRNRRRRQSEQHGGMFESDTHLYRDLAGLSGGHVIEVTSAELAEASIIIAETTRASLVTLLQATTNPGRAEEFTFTVDETIRNLAAYITGTPLHVTLLGPSGESESVTKSQSVGNLRVLKLNTQVGEWRIRIDSPNPYTLRVVAQSPIDFLFDFLDVSMGPLGGFADVNNRPRAGVNSTLVVTLIGSNSATVTEVSLVPTPWTGQFKSSAEAHGRGIFTAKFDQIPSDDFVVLVKGLCNTSSPFSFQRQSLTSIRASSLNVTTDELNIVLMPGTPLLVAFTVMTSRAGGTILIQVTNDQGFNATFPSSLLLDTGVEAKGEVNITAPSRTASGTVATLTIEAKDPVSNDINYVVVLLTVLERVTDFRQPMCELISLQPNCSGDCSFSSWKLSIKVTDHNNGTGVDRVTLRKGNGTMNTSMADEAILVQYEASCCSPDVQMLVVDQVGNVGLCSYTVRTFINGAQALSASVVQTCLLCFVVVILGHI